MLAEYSLEELIARWEEFFSEIGVEPEWITPTGELRTLPCHFSEYDGIDGFFCARLVKNG